MANFYIPLVASPPIGDNSGGGGSGGGAFVVHATWGDTPETEDTCTLDKTWNEINTAAQTMPVYIVGVSDAGAGDECFLYLFGGTSVDQSISGNTYKIIAFAVYEGTVTDYTFSTDSADGYPAYDGSGD